MCFIFLISHVTLLIFSYLLKKKCACETSNNVNFIADYKKYRQIILLLQIFFASFEYLYLPSFSNSFSMLANLLSAILGDLVDRKVSFQTRLNGLEGAVFEAAVAAELTVNLVEQSQHKAKGAGFSHYAVMLNGHSNSDRPTLTRDNLVREFWANGPLLLQPEVSSSQCASNIVPTLINPSRLQLPSTVPAELQLWVSKIYGEGATLSLEQLQLIDALVAGHDAVCRLRTGAGKSVAVLFSARLPGSTVVVAPTRALCFDLEQRCRQAGISAIVWRGRGALSVERRQHLTQLSTRVRIVIMMPEDCCSVSFCAFETVLKAVGNTIKRVIIDEVHVDWKAFRKQFGEINKLVWLTRAQKIFLSATLSEQRLREVVEQYSVSKSRQVYSFHFLAALLTGLTLSSLSIKSVKAPYADLALAKNGRDSIIEMRPPILCSIS